MGAYITWKPKAGPTKDLYFDAVVEEAAEIVSTPTEYPVEEGANVSDHVKDELKRVSLEVFVSNQPVYDWNRRGGTVKKLPIKVKQYKAPLAPTPGAVFSAVGSAVRDAVGSLLGKNEETAAQVLQFNEDFDAVAGVLATLEELQASRQLVLIITKAREYEGMFLEKIGPRRNAASGDGATFQLEFRQLRIVESKLVAAPTPTEVRGQIKKSKGAQSPKNAKAAVEKKSIAKGLIDALLGN